MSKFSKIILAFVLTALFITSGYSQDVHPYGFNSGNHLMYASSGHEPLRNLLFEKNYISDNTSHNERINSLSSKLSLSPENTNAGLIQGIFAGYSLPLTPLKGNTQTISVKNNQTQTTSYFVKHGITGGISEKLPFGKKGNVRLVMDFSYSYFFQSGNDSIGIYTIKPKMQIFQAGLGCEYAFTSIDRVEPFIGAEINGNIFGGSTEFLNNALGTDTVKDLNMVTRYGFTVGAGVNYKLNKDLGFVFGAKYTLTNLIGKSSNLDGARELNDAAYTLEGYNVSAKTISFIKFYLGLSIYLGSSQREIPW